MKHLFLFLFCLPGYLLLAHGHDQEHVDLRHWSVSSEKQTVDASFLMFKNGEVYLEQADHGVVHFPLSAFSAGDQAFVRQRYAQIEHLNEQLDVAQPTQMTHSAGKIWWWGFLLVALCAWTMWSASRKVKMRLLPVAAIGLLAGLYAFKSDISRMLFSTDPAFIDSAFQPFKPAVHTFWDADYFYVESKGIPDHEMMTGITKWQQQVPIPQCYIGDNAWSIPLNPVIAPAPVPVNPQHFIRGAIAIAANGVPIFNPYTNTGVDALLDGQLDNFGGHCGRGDDYHYHVAPLQLDAQTPEVLPIAFALDGFAVYGSQEPDGSAMSPLDANHGHYGANGVYHYHGTATAPYMIGNMVGKVTEDTTMQIVPQAHANPIRPAQVPLQGAVITACVPNGANNGYTLTYTKSGQTYSVDYNWTPSGQYTFHFNTPSGTTTQNFNGFVPCEVPTATDDFSKADEHIVVFPNPAKGVISLNLNGLIVPDDVQGIVLFNSNGERVFQTVRYQSDIAVQSLPKGVYFLNIQSATGQLTRKVVIQ